MTPRQKAVAVATADLSSPRLSPTILRLKRERIARYSAMTDAQYEAEAAATTAHHAPTVSRMAAELLKKAR